MVRILLVFKHKTVRAKAVAVHCFTRSMGLTQRAVTHTAQKHHTQTEDVTKDFIAMMKVKLQGRNLDDIMNMDQTPIPYSYHSSKMLNPKGAKTVQGRSSISETKHVTLAVTVTTSEKLLMPFLIFKGQRNGRIAQHEFVTYLAAGKYACQPKAWLDKALMNKWIDIILMPWKADCDANSPSLQPPILVLGSVVNQIQAMGVEVIPIPAGCRLHLPVPAR